MTSRAFLHGAGGVAGLVWDPIAAGVNKVESLAGVNANKYGLNNAQQNIDYALNKLGVPDYQPVNGVERVASAVDQGLGGMASGFGIGSALKSAASPIAQGIGAALTSNPVQQMALTGAGSGSSAVAKEAGAGPTGQILAGLAGGGAPAILGAGKQSALRALSGIIGSPSDEAAQLAQTALSHGIPLKASQVSPSMSAKLMDSASSHVPFSGSGAFQDTQQQAFNRAVGQSIGVNEPKITAPVFNQAKQDIGVMYDDLATRVHPQITPDVQQKLDDVLQNAQQFGADDSIRAVGSALQRVKDQAPNGILPGPAYKSLDSQLGTIAKNGGEKGNYAKQVQQVLRDAFTNSASPGDAAQMQLANQRYANLKTIEPLVAKNGVEGDISPAALMGRVTANQAGKAAMANGRRGDLGDLANIGQRFLKEPIADSGTARRVAAFQALKQGGTLAAGAGAGSLVGLPSALLTGAGMVGGARGAQRILQSQSLVNAMLGNTPTSQLDRLMLMSASPAAQSLIQPHH